MPTYEVELSDGRKFEVDADAQPSEQDVMAAIGSHTAAPQPAKAAPGRTWTDTAVDALPMLGGLGGSIAGAGAGTVFGMGVGAVPGAIGGATLGGGLGEAARQLVNRLRGKEAPATPLAAASEIGQQGAMQGAAEGGGRLISKGLQMAAKPVYNLGLGAAKGLRMQYPTLAETGLNEAIAVSGRGTNKAGRLLTQSAQHADDLIAAAERAGAPTVAAKDVLTGGGFQQVAREARNRAQLGMANDVGDVVDRGRMLIAKNPGGIPLTQAQILKRVAQQEANAAFRTQAKGGAIKTVTAQLDKATATGLKRAIEKSVPEVGPINQRTQALGGLKRALVDAEARNHILSQLLVPGATGLGAGAITGDYKTGLGAGAAMSAIRSPGALSRAAILAYKAGQIGIPAQLLRALTLAKLENEQKNQ